jgi:hypothetical protein
MIVSKELEKASPPLAGLVQGRGWWRLKLLMALVSLLSVINGSAQIRGERIDGPANVRFEPNGDLAFSLNDNVLVDAGPIKDGWAEIKLTIEIPFNVKNSYSPDSGNAIIDIIGDTLGFIIGNVMTSIATGDKSAWCTFYGYTHENNIIKESIIENIVSQNLNSIELTHLDWFDFIEEFQLEKFDSIGGYEIYMNYESINPSPGFRIALLFENYNLVGILHSRPISKNDYMEDYPIDGHYSVLFAHGYSKNKISAFQKELAVWLNGVD